MKLDIYQVDAFSAKVFGGNPAAVVPLSSWPEDALMQSIAQENNLSETAFFVKQDTDYALRWFTPVCEVDLCGHATLAAAYVILNHIEPQRGEVAFHTRSGRLAVERHEGMLRMDFPSMPPVIDPATLDEALRLRPEAVLAAGVYHLAACTDEKQVRECTPDFAAISRLERLAVIVTAPGRDCDFVSRVFGPKVGIPEDPVTGSAHCLLAPYWAERFGKTSLHARQISRRGGELFCELAEDRVLISGRAVLYLKGEILLEARDD